MLDINSMRKLLAVVPLLLATSFSLAQSSTWNFVVSGDSRNCGDIVMTAIASGAKKDNAQFYWHLGDLRAIFGIDEDISGRPGARVGTVRDYQKMAWQDFIDNQIGLFGDTPFFLGIGNHETIAPKNRTEFVQTFSKWLDAPPIHDQRAKDDPSDLTVKTYYHWHLQGIDFIYLDNATADEFDPGQITWFEKILAADKQDGSTKAVVLGMHAALPNSFAAGHSMNNWRVGESSGDRVYTDLVDFRNQSHKRVYILASHSHFYMKNIFNTEYWKSNGGVLPGWIVGTAGAHRYKLPPDAHKADEAKTDVYGYLLATAHDDGTVDFKFKEIKESAIAPDVVDRFGKGLVHECFVGNSDTPHR